MVYKINYGTVSEDDIEIEGSYNKITGNRVTVHGHYNDFYGWESHANGSYNKNHNHDPYHNNTSGGGSYNEGFCLRKKLKPQPVVQQIVQQVILPKEEPKPDILLNYPWMDADIRAKYQAVLANPKAKEELAGFEALQKKERDDFEQKQKIDFKNSILLIHDTVVDQEAAKLKAAGELREKAQQAAILREKEKELLAKEEQLKTWDLLLRMHEDQKRAQAAGATNTNGAGVPIVTTTITTTTGPTQN